MKTFIFGAGASIPFFSPILSTSYLTNQVCDIENWNRVIQKYKDNQGSNHQIVGSNLIVEVINDISSVIPYANFEQIAEVIDKISSLGFDSLPLNNMMNLIFYLYLKNVRVEKQKPFGLEWIDVPFLYREILVEAILDLQEKHKAHGYDNLIELQRQYIKFICQADEQVNIMSLNYDDCINESLVGLGFERGFKIKDQNYLEQLDIKDFMTLKKVVYYPHGHLKFQFVDNDNVTYWHDSNLANKMRWESLNRKDLGTTLTSTPGKFSYNYNTFIFTGQTKDEGLNYLPYAIYYQRLSVDILRSDIIYIIGYSFGDNHFNRLLHSFLKMDDNHKVLIVDFYSDEITTTKEYSSPDNIIFKIYNTLLTSWEVFVDKEGNLHPKNSQEIDNLNKKGYGLLFPQVYFYKKGYEAFLNEYENVLDIMQ